MKKSLLLGFVGVLALTACGKNTTPVVTGGVYNFAARTLTPPDAAYTAQAGTATRNIVGASVLTVLNATKLKPSTEYIAHYHKTGVATAKPCDSNGPVVGGLIGGKAVTTDANGNLKITGGIATADLTDATYINIHESAAPTVIPLCADITVTPATKF